MKSQMRLDGGGAHEARRRPRLHQEGAELSPDQRILPLLSQKSWARQPRRNSDSSAGQSASRQRAPFEPLLSAECFAACLRSGAREPVFQVLVSCL